MKIKSLHDLIDRLSGLSPTIRAMGLPPEITDKPLALQQRSALRHQPRRGSMESPAEASEAHSH